MYIYNIGTDISKIVGMLQVYLILLICTSNITNFLFHKTLAHSDTYSDILDLV